MKRAQLVIAAAVFVLAACQPQSTSNTSSSTASEASVATETSMAVVKTPLSRAETKLHTAVNIQIYHEGQEAAMDEAFAYMDRMEELLTTNREGSDVYKINHAAGQAPVKVDSSTFAIVKQALETAELSNGKFDITIGAITNLWRIGEPDARKPSDEEIQAALPKIDYRKVKIDDANQTVYLEEAGMQIELGGISKGYIADGIREIFAKHGITTAVINLGGNVVVMGTSPNSSDGWNVGVQDPDEVRGETVGARRVTDGTVVTSGLYELYVEVDGVRYHHILNPKTGYPIENQLSGVTIFTKQSVKADALSTTLFLMGVEDGLKFIESLEGVEAVLIDKNHGVYLTSGLKDSFKLTNEGYHLVDN